MFKEKQGKVPYEPSFLVEGENLALYLVNTEIMKRGKPLDLLNAPEDVATWWQETRTRYPAFDEVRGDGEDTMRYDEALFTAVKTVRSALRAIFSALIDERVPDGQDVDVLNAVLRQSYSSLELDEQGRLVPVMHTTDREHGRLLLPVALAATRLISQGEHKRLHQCDNERCILFFYDSTKSATRRWCSLGCMDRARSVQRYREAKWEKR